MCPEGWVLVAKKCVEKAPRNADVAPWSTIGLVLVLAGLVILAILAYDELNN